MWIFDIFKRKEVQQPDDWFTIGLYHGNSLPDSIEIPTSCQAYRVNSAFGGTKDFMQLSINSIKSLVSGLFTVVCVTSKDNRSIVPHFPLFLKAYAPQIPVFTKEERVLIVAGTGLNPILELLSHQNEYFYDLTVYGYSQAAEIKEFQEMQDLMTLEGFCIFADCYKGEDGLDIVVDHSKISYQRVFDSVQAACDAMGEVLEVFPQA